MLMFNSIQIVALFSGFPFLIGWLWSDAAFPGVFVAKWVAALTYIVFFMFMVGVTFKGIEKG